jgi:hypothetical protein
MVSVIISVGIAQAVGCMTIQFRDAIGFSSKVTITQQEPEVMR